VCSDFSGIKDATIACVAYPAANLRGTNFEAGAFSVSRLDATTVSECLSVPEPPPHVGTARTETVNGVTFNVTETDGVAMGNLIDAYDYRSFHGNRCYELDIRIAFANIGNFDPGTVKEFDDKAVYSSLKSVLNTFKFVK
jgi:hypothetical protein